MHIIIYIYIYIYSNVNGLVGIGLLGVGHEQIHRVRRIKQEDVVLSAHAT